MKGLIWGDRRTKKSLPQSLDVATGTFFSNLVLAPFLLVGVLMVALLMFAAAIGLFVF